MSHYSVLGVARSASRRELRSAYVSLARSLHPDVLASSVPPPTPAAIAAANARMARVNEAWNVLCDPARRRAYDATLPREAVPGGYRMARQAGFAVGRVIAAVGLVADRPGRGGSRR